MKEETGKMDGKTNRWDSPLFFLVCRGKLNNWMNKQTLVGSVKTCSVSHLCLRWRSRRAESFRSVGPAGWFRALQKLWANSPFKDLIYYHNVVNNNEQTQLDTGLIRLLRQLVDWRHYAKSPDCGWISLTCELQSAAAAAWFSCIKVKRCLSQESSRGIRRRHPEVALLRDSRQLRVGWGGLIYRTREGFRFQHLWLLQAEHRQTIFSVWW